jgi:hypothetical protein
MDAQIIEWPKPIPQILELSGLGESRKQLLSDRLHKECAALLYELSEFFNHLRVTLGRTASPSERKRPYRGVDENIHRRSLRAL